jgi:hypothetical protein
MRRKITCKYNQSTIFLNKNSKTRDQLSTASKLIEQLGFKVERLENQLTEHRNELVIVTNT